MQWEKAQALEIEESEFMFRTYYHLGDLLLITKPTIVRRGLLTHYTVRDN